MTGELVLCYSEEPAVSLELVRLALSLPLGETGRAVALILPDAPAESSEALCAAGAHSVQRVLGAPSRDPHMVAETLRAAIAALRPSLILIGSTKRGREVTGRLAGSLDLPAVTGATGLRLDAEGIHVEREALSGNAVAVERISLRPALVAVMPGVAPGAPAGAIRAAALTEQAMPVGPSLVESREVRPKPGGKLEIEKAERIVTIGRGLKKKEDLGIVEALARSLGAEVGCTRPIAAEAGWLTDDHWIGLTGHRVHPKLYVAVGVSGAVQHLVGMRASKVVVAINKDPNAPIFAQADYRISGDLYQVLPALTKVLGG